MDVRKHITELESILAQMTKDGHWTQPQWNKWMKELDELCIKGHSIIRNDDDST